MKRLSGLASISINEALVILKKNVVLNADVIRILLRFNGALPDQFYKTVKIYRLGEGVVVIHDTFSPFGWSNMLTFLSAQLRI